MLANVETHTMLATRVSRQRPRNPSGCDLLGPDTEQCRNAVEACSQVESPAVGEVWRTTSDPDSDPTTTHWVTTSDDTTGHTVEWG